MPASRARCLCRSEGCTGQFESKARRGRRQYLTEMLLETPGQHSEDSDSDPPDPTSFYITHPERRYCWFKDLSKFGRSGTKICILGLLPKGGQHNTSTERPLNYRRHGPFSLNCCHFRACQDGLCRSPVKVQSHKRSKSPVPDTTALPKQGRPTQPGHTPRRNRHGADIRAARAMLPR